MKYKWLLFDADGTLFDYERASEEAFRLTFEESGNPYDHDYLGHFRKINDALWTDLELGKINPERLKTKRFELLFELLGIIYDSEEFSRRYLVNLSKGTCLIGGAKEVVESLSKRYNLLLITNGLKEVQRPRFENSEIFSFFNEIIISEEVGAAKPSSKIFDITFEKMNNPAKSEVLIIGDGLTSDILGGVNYGIDACWFNPMHKPEGNIKAGYVIYDLRELEGLLEDKGMIV